MNKNFSKVNIVSKLAILDYIAQPKQFWAEHSITDFRRPTQMPDEKNAVATCSYCQVCIGLTPPIYRPC